MPIDPNIALGVKVPDQMQSLSSLMGVANTAQQMQGNAIAIQNNAMSLQQRQATKNILSNIASYKGDDGSLDVGRLQGDLARYGGDTGVKLGNDIAVAHQNGIAADKAWNGLNADKQQYVANALTALPDNAPPDLVHKTLDTVNQQFKGQIAPTVSHWASIYDQAVAQGGPQAGRQALGGIMRGVLPQPTQQDMASGGLAPVSTDKGTVLVQTKTGASTPQGGQVGQTFAPPNQFVTTPTGRMAVGNPASGAVSEPTAAGGTSQPPVNFPAGESQQTFNDLQNERTAAKNVALNAPVLHDINRTIISEVNKGTVDTGRYGQIKRDLASRMPWLNDSGGATDYDMLGKMLERSALTAAQNMGPHTNAGLEASVRANGSTQYTPTALKKIATLNDALVSGSQLYHDGLERAIAGNPNNVFAKREFDTAWGKVATPQVLRLKNAVDNGNQEEVGNILQEVGGKNSAGARKLHQQLTQMLQLTGQ